MFCPGCGTTIGNVRLVDPRDMARPDPVSLRAFLDCDPRPDGCGKSWRVLLVGKQMTNADRLVLHDAMRTVLTHPAGLGIELAADLWLDRLEDGRFRVADRCSPDGQTFEELFDDVDRAIIRYLFRRDERQLGLDYEVEPSKGGPRCVRCEERPRVILADTCFRCTTAEEVAQIKQRWAQLSDAEKTHLQREHRRAHGKYPGPRHIPE